MDYYNDLLRFTQSLFDNCDIREIWLMDYSLYIHIPFCSVQCTYCAFNVYTRQEALIPNYVAALCREIGWVGQSSAPPIHTIYLGGGTPSLLTPEQIAQILDTCRRAFQVRPNAEITLEANPGGLTVDYFRALRASGVNRISIGMQSTHADELRMFARPHGFDAVAETVAAARAAGHSTVSLDLIYGVPHQTLAMWQSSVSAALFLQPDHLSIYALQLESGTPLAARVERGALPTPDDDLAADMYEAADEMFGAAGFAQYEISAWARGDHECRHNLQYWRNQPYIGVGAGAHGYALNNGALDNSAGGIRYQVVRGLQAYITRANAQDAPLPFPLTAAVEQHQTIERDQQMDDTLMTGLRLLREGVSRAEFLGRFGIALDTVYADALAHLAAYDMLDTSGDRLTLRPRARLISNQVLLHFIREKSDSLSVSL